MTLEEAAEVHRSVLGGEIHKGVRAVTVESDRQLVRKVADGFRVPGAEGQRRQIPARELVREREMRDLLPFGRQPRTVAVGEDGIEDHQLLHRARERRRPPVPVVWLAYGTVERLEME